VDARHRLDAVAKRNILASVGNRTPVYCILTEIPRFMLHYEIRPKQYPNFLCFTIRRIKIRNEIRRLKHSDWYDDDDDDNNITTNFNYVVK
jgi:hypothetical protein